MIDGKVLHIVSEIYRNRAPMFFGLNMDYSDDNTNSGGSDVKSL
jgi:hypothetical protein